MLLSSFDCLVWTATDTIYPFRGNIEDALQKIQAIIDAASYVPPPPSEEQKKKVEKM
jgi:hypothetical protein